MTAAFPEIDVSGILKEEVGKSSKRGGGGAAVGKKRKTDEAAKGSGVGDGEGTPPKRKAVSGRRKGEIMGESAIKVKEESDESSEGGEMVKLEQ